MALASRFLSRSKQLHGSVVALQQQHAISVRSFAKETGAARPTFKGDEMLKEVFMEIKTKFLAAVDVLRKEKITINPDDPAAVRQYANVMKTIRKKADMFSESQRIQYDIDIETKEIPDAREYLLKLQEIRERKGLTDELGAEAMMFEALDKVEKEIKKPLMRDDKKGMALLMAEFDKINKKLGIRKEDLPKYEEELELKIAKVQLEELKSEALEAMEAQKKKEEFQDEAMPDVKSLDIRNFI
ncbi:PREDICTED: probable ATP synthase 24 kDa subunit, mitochondrial [Tarenaya hassleriana]|uniref:probable ATP synthase 24 kDa subunit, mitochondrial n=1 Tax=Tarenaya hassleriana TaxID=28532 RepID=UPI00053C1137|nr:PREDICTED: probable ATP synthase 24 kDa subunit, mitochondrial [Tarenaya hassleriana]